MLDSNHLYKEHEIKYSSGEKDYIIYHLKSNEVEGCNFDCLVNVPIGIGNNARIVMKCHNTGSPSIDTKQGIEENILIAEDSIEGSFKYLDGQSSILVVPLIIQRPDGEYYQQLTRKALLDKTPGFERVDVQIVNAINSIKKLLRDEDGFEIKEKIDLVGFSAAGSFAQRFMFLHPEIVRAIYAGGSMDGIPLPVAEINGQKLHYPLGLSDYKEITGHEFNLHAYKSIAMRFSYGAKEKEQISNHYFDEYGNPVSNFDMSYIRSITPETDGLIMRNIIGKTPEERFRKTIEVYRLFGIDIEASIYPDLGHRESMESIDAAKRFFRRVNEKEESIHSLEEI